MDFRAKAVSAPRLPIFLSMFAAMTMATMLAAPAVAQQPSPSAPEEVLPAPQPKATPPRAAAKKAAEPETPSTPAPVAQTPAAGCSYLGKRVVQSLLRDDAVTAGDFERVYHTFSCSGEHLRTAFDCTVSAPLPANANDQSARVDACWADPKFDAKLNVDSQTPTTPGQATKGEAKSGETKGGAKSGETKSGDAKSGETKGSSESKGESRSKAKATSTGTPNYTNPTATPKSGQ